MKDLTAPLDEQPIIAEAARFLNSARTLNLATVDVDNKPHASYAPFALIDQSFYILVSDLAQHGANLKATERASIMLIEDESRARQLFARRRLSYDVAVNCIPRDSDVWQQATAQLRDRFGNTVDMLLQLEDFRLYQLTPEQGRYVKGFGKAFHINAEQRVALQQELEQLRQRSDK